MYRMSLVTTAILVASAASADTHAPKMEMEISCNDKGAIIELGEDSVEPGATYYFGTNCGAYRPGVGAGSWWQAEGAYMLDIHGQTLTFANELGCKTLPVCSAP